MKKIILAIIIILITAVTAFADLVVLENGDIIVGDIISETETTITIRTSFGDITVDKDMVVEIRKESEYDTGEIVEIILYDGSRIRGTIIEDTAETLKIQTELGLIDIPKANISSVVTGGTTESGSVDDKTGTSGYDEEYYEKLLEYRKRAIFVDIFTYQRNDKQDWLIRQGGFILSEIDFLKEVDRTPLANQIEEDMRQRSIFKWGSVVSGAVFGVATFIGVSGLFSEPTEGLTPDQSWTLIGVGGTLTIASAIAFVFTLPKDHYLSFTEAKAYAEEYNLKLRQELGLTIQDVNLIGGSKGNNGFIDENGDYIEYRDLGLGYENPISFMGGLAPSGMGINLFLYINF
jgi:RNase P/RNase MRP subunit p29